MVQPLHGFIKYIFQMRTRRSMSWEIKASEDRLAKRQQKTIFHIYAIHFMTEDSGNSLRRLTIPLLN